MKAIAYTVLSAIGLYLAFRWDYHTSDIIFEAACSDSAQVGMHFYQRPELTEDLVIPISENNDEPYDSERFIQMTKLMLDQVKFSQKYEFVRRRIETISRIGPVYRITSSITRKQDGTLFSQMVTVRSQRGWLSNLLAQGYDSRDCPDYGNSILRGVPKQVAYHSYLVPLTFTQP
ncbi:MAG: hypothetical protein R3E54_10475 [Halioglobus sp.]